MADLCIPIALEVEDLGRLEQIVNRGQSIRRGQHIFRVNEPFSALYAVRVGAVKTYQLTTDGQEQITGFYLPGEIFGMDGIGDAMQTNSAVALEKSAVCAIPFAGLEQLAQQIPSLRRHLFKLMSREIVEEQKLITLLSKNTAEQRLAALFLSLSKRYAMRGLSTTQLRLPMSRGDIANYLGLRIETVSRVLNRLQTQQIILVDNKELRILDIASLREVASGPGE